MKKIIYSAFIALGFCACDNTEEILNQTPETLHSPAVYHMSLQASFDAQTRSVTFGNDGTSITTQFESTDKIYVYNETKQAFARDASEDHLLSYLQPTNSGVSCTLEGNLSFYKLNDSQEWETVTVDDADTYSLYYQMNEPDYTSKIQRFNYDNQDGSAETASEYDFAEATGITMSLSGTTLTVPDDILFQNLQSMFRQRLSFKKDDETVTPTITKLTVDTKNGTLLLYYHPYFENPDQFETFDLDIYSPQITADGDIYLSLAFYYPNANTASGDQLILTAVDNEGNVYEGVKNVPTGGFQNSKYYYGSCELVWQSQDVKPEVTRSDGGDGDELNPDADGWYNIYGGTDDQIEITISGNSLDYRFYLNDDPAVVTLTGTDNPVSAYWSGNNAFIESDDDLTIILDRDYVIDNSLAFEKGIDCGGELKLKTTGSTQTLTVITNDDGSFAYGIYGDSNFDAWIYEFNQIGNLAADGFSVSCPGPVDNEDGTYTWVYTVTPNN